MEIIIAITAVIWSVLGIILFFKIWNMTNNVKEIHDWLITDRYQNQITKEIDLQNPTKSSRSRSIREYPGEKLKIERFTNNLKKGDLVTITKFGTCRFKGIWQGKYAFYPESITDLPESPYLVNDVEPYILIPGNELGDIIN